MALSATIYNFNISLSDVDRGVYEELKLQLARHPSETLPYLLTRLIAYCLEYREGISFTKGLSEADEPAIWAHDPTGQLSLWVEVGLPSALRLHRAAKAGAEVCVYTHKNAETLLTQLSGERIHDAQNIKIYSLASSFLDEVSALVERRNNLSISVSERQIYISIAGRELTGALQTHPLLNTTQ